MAGQFCPAMRRNSSTVGWEVRYSERRKFSRLCLSPPDSRLNLPITPLASDPWLACSLRACWMSLVRPGRQARDLRNTTGEYRHAARGRSSAARRPLAGRVLHGALGRELNDQPGFDLRRATLHLIRLELPLPQRVLDGGSLIGSRADGVHVFHAAV